MKVRLTDNAKRDINEIWWYVAGHSRPSTAQELLAIFDKKMHLLSVFPELGNLRPDFAPGPRAILADQYFIIYKIEKSTIDVVRVVHTARDLPSLFH